jgi:hypothetical protein
MFLHNVAVSHVRNITFTFTFTFTSRQVLVAVYLRSCAVK